MSREASFDARRSTFFFNILNYILKMSSSGLKVKFWLTRPCEFDVSLKFSICPRTSALNRKLLVFRDLKVMISTFRVKPGEIRDAEFVVTTRFKPVVFLLRI